MRCTQLKIALVDNETECLREMEQICRDFGNRFQCQAETASFSCGEAFLDALASETFSVVFMDIYMDGMDGVATALKMRERDSRCLLVFLTSSAEFMPDAFSCHAFEYITKPFTKERVMTVLADALKLLPASQKYAELAVDRKTVRVFFDSMVCAVTDAHYVDIDLTDGNRLHCRMTLSELLDKTEHDPRFISVNKGILANADHILNFEDSCCLLDNGRKLPLRVRERLKIEQTVRDYHFNRMRKCQAHFDSFPDSTLR